MELADNINTTTRRIKEDAQTYRDGPLEGQGQSLLNAKGFHFLKIKVSKNRQTAPAASSVLVSSESSPPLALKDHPSHLPVSEGEARCFAPKGSKQR